MEAAVRKLFERYESVFNRSLGDVVDMDEVASLYASDFIAASPAGVMTGKNDDQLKQVMEQGYARYRAIGTREMRIRDISISPIDFEVHYLVQKLDGEAKVFGWVSGDEQALLKKHGIG
jgi:hypothetical protein